MGRYIVVHADGSKEVAAASAATYGRSRRDLIRHRCEHCGTLVVTDGLSTSYPTCCGWFAAPPETPPCPT